MRRFLVVITLLSLGASMAAQAAPAAKPAAKPAEKASSDPANLPSEATVDSFIRQMFGYQADLSWKISSIQPAGVAGLVEIKVIMAGPEGQQLLRFYSTPDGQHAIFGEIVPFAAKPFEPVKVALEKGISGPSRGPKDAPVTIVEFGDLQCPACKAAQPKIEELVASEPNVRFVFQNFPLEMHNWAAKGATYSDCVGRASNDAFWKFLSTTYLRQAQITAENADEKLTEVANDSGLNGTEIAACAAKSETKARVDASVALGKAVDVTGTPTLYINGRKIGNFDGQQLEVYKSLIEFAAKPGN